MISPDFPRCEPRFRFRMCANLRSNFLAVRKFHTNCTEEPKKQMTTTTESPATVLGSEDSFRLLVESVKDYAIIMLDPGGHVASWNAGAERIKVYPSLLRPRQMPHRHPRPRRNHRWRFLNSIRRSGRGNAGARRSNPDELGRKL